MATRVRSLAAIPICQGQQEFRISANLKASIHDSDEPGNSYQMLRSKLITALDGLNWFASK